MADPLQNIDLPDGLRPDDEPLDEGPDSGLLDVLQHPDHDRPAALDHAEDRDMLAATLRVIPPPHDDTAA